MPMKRAVHLDRPFFVVDFLPILTNLHPQFCVFWENLTLVYLFHHEIFNMRTVLRNLLGMALIGASSLAYGQTYTVGTNNGTNTTTSYPTPFGDYYKTQRAQYLYRSDELVAAGMGAGDITSVAFTVSLPYIITDIDGGVTENYTIKILSTGVTSLSTTLWESGATTVWGPSNYIPVEGVNTFTLASPFYWDGASNLIIEICGGLPAGEWEENAQVIWTTGLAFNGSHTFRSDIEPAVCDYSGATFSGTATNRPQIIFGAAAATDCEGTPVAGAASSDMGSVCPTDMFTVSIDPTVAGGITYQWASSADGVTYSDILGATGPSYTTSQASATYYQCTVTCTPSGESSVSDATYVMMNAAMDCYCEPTYTTGTGFGDYLENVTLGAINNTTGAGPAPYYTYFEGVSTDVELEGTYTIYATVGTYTFNDVAAWIDYNHDGAFDEVTEKLGQVDNVGASGIAEITFTIPVSAMTGATRLRVREADQGLTIESCETLTYGETEDYDINIIPSTCPMVTDLYVDGITDNDAVMHWTGVDGAEQYRITLWNTVTGQMARKGVTTTSYESIDNLTPLTTYAFRVKTVCYDEEVVGAPTEWVYWTTLGREGDMSNGSAFLYPNPSNGVFTLQLNNMEANTYTMQVFDALGNAVMMKNIDVTGTQYTENIDLSHLSSGMYHIQVYNSSVNMSYPAVIQK